MVDTVLISFGVIAFVVGMVVYIVQFRQGLKADASKKWPTASGTVTASALEKVPDNRWRYRAALQYGYRVRGKDYQSSRVFWGGNEGREKHMASVVETYPAGCKVRVYYDPKNPADAVLDPIQNTGSRTAVLYGMAMMTLGLFSLTGGVIALFQ
ncbi:MAG: DUF3592 domain-containing protein [Xanthobacteraceae bacterium]|jgi:Protein of unknown function (DUF3592)